MDETLLQAFRDTCYLVCLDEVTWAEIRVDQPLPALLQDLVGDNSWGFITAWHPHAVPAAPGPNLAAQRKLRDALREWPGVVIHPGIGIGDSGWHEPSLFVIGPDLARLDQLASEYGQLAYVHGQGSAPARLRLPAG